MSLDATLTAPADPTRRAILSRLTLTAWVEDDFGRLERLVG